MGSEAGTQIAWQPFTPRGVAAFASSSLKRVWLVQLVFALLAAAAVVWFVGTRWYPAIREAIQKLPAAGTVRGGTFTWEGESPIKLAENHFLSISIDLKHEGLVRSPAHLQVEFGARDYAVLGLFGAAQIPYGKAYVIKCSREELQPWWGAWAPIFLGVLALVSLAWVFCTWAILSFIYTPVAWLVALFANRNLRLREAYRLCGAALMPGALVMCAVIVLYGVGALDPIKLLIGFGLHLLTGLAYVIAAPFWLPRAPDVMPTKNPFGDKPASPNSSPPESPK